MNFRKNAIIRVQEAEAGWMRRVRRAAAPRKRVVVPEAVTVPYIPSPLLVNALVANGMPRRHAKLITTSTRLYWIATRFYFDLIEAENGDEAAKERIAHFQGQQARLREIEKEQLKRDPDRTEPVKVGRTSRGTGSQSSIIVPRGIGNGPR